MADILAIGRNAKPKTRTIDVCLDGDVEERLATLSRDLLTAQTQDEASFSGGEAKKVMAKIAVATKEAVEASITFHLRKLHYLRPLDLQAAHPPRKDNKEDAAHGFNRETYYPALVQECCYQVSHPDGTTLEAAELTADWWVGVWGAVNYQQFDRLFGAAYSINHMDAAAPFLLAASRTSPATDSTSKRPEPTASPPNGSPAGSRPKRRRTPTTKKAAAPKP